MKKYLLIFAVLAALFLAGCHLPNWVKHPLGFFEKKEAARADQVFTVGATINGQPIAFVKDGVYKNSKVTVKTKGHDVALTIVDEKEAAFGWLKLAGGLIILASIILFVAKYIPLLVGLEGVGGGLAVIFVATFPWAILISLAIGLGISIVLHNKTAVAAYLSSLRGKGGALVTKIVAWVKSFFVKKTPPTPPVA